ncbi:MAG TPA: hypothetical protein OIM29_01860 [Oscillospiraceae bacterium]|nr:hypothetical protein [Oscillospiraceae bacterium]
MAISNNTKNKYQQYNNPYVESEAQKQQREIAQQLAYSQPNNAPNNYAQQMQEMYNRVASKGAFSYDKANDKAYQQYAKMYQQLGGLSMAATQQAANELTAGYGSTYSPQVAMQTDNAYQANVNSALPSYYQMAQNEYDALRQKDLTNYEAAIEGYQNAENSNLNRKNAWADIVNSAAGRSNQENANAVNNYADNKDFWYQQYWNEQNAMNDQVEAKNERYWNNNKLKEEKKENKRDEYWAMNEVNVSIAADKADSYRDKKDNKGMKAYLQNQVKKGNITQYQADGIYKQYKYTAPKSSGRSSSGRRSGGSSSYSYTSTGSVKDTENSENSNIYNKDGKLKSVDEMKIGKGIIMQISSVRGDGTETQKDKNGNFVTNPGAETQRSRNQLINKLLQEKKINNDQAEWLTKYYDL